MAYYYFSILKNFNLILWIVAQAYLLKNIRKWQNVVGVSGKMQMLYAAAISMKCLQFICSDFIDVPNTIVFISLHVIWLFVTAAILLAIYKAYNATYEIQNDEFSLKRLVIPCALLAILANDGPLYGFGCYLELVAMIPQLYYFKKAKKIEKFMGYYMVLIMVYKASCVLDGLKNHLDYGGYYSRYNVAEMICDTVQLIIYCDYLIHQGMMGNGENEAATKDEKFNNNLSEVVLSPNLLMQKDEKVDIFTVPLDQNKNNGLPAKF